MNLNNSPVPSIEVDCQSGRDRKFSMDSPSVDFSNFRPLNKKTGCNADKDRFSDYVGLDRDKNIIDKKGLSTINESEERLFRESHALEYGSNLEQQSFVDHMSKFVSGTGDNTYPFSRGVLSKIEEDNESKIGDVRQEPSFNDLPVFNRVQSNSFSIDFNPTTFVNLNRIIDPRKVSISIGSPGLESRSSGK